MALHLARPPFLPARIPPPHRRARAHYVFPSAEARSASFRRPYTSVLVVPTGVGAAVGGFAGDALPVARALAAVADCVISHPNVLNAAMLYWPMPNMLYVEGYALDRFAEGAWALQPVHQNKVGLVLDAGIEDELRLRHLQVADAARDGSKNLTLGVQILTNITGPGRQLACARCHIIILALLWFTLRRRHRSHRVSPLPR